MSNQANGQTKIDFNGDTYTVWSADGICLCWTKSLTKALRMYQTEIDNAPVQATFLYDLQTA